MRRLLLTFALGAAAFCFAQEAEHKAATSGEAHHEEEGDPRIVLKWANFAILVGVLGWGLAKSLPPFFKARSEEIAREMAEAAKLKADAEAKAAEIEQRMSRLGTEIETLRAKAKQEMQVEADRIKRETENFIAKIHDGALADIEAAAKRSKAELKSIFAQHALDLAEQRIRRGLQNGGGLVDRFINDLGKAKGTNN